MIAELVLYIIFGAVAVASAITMILVKNPVHSAMFLVVNFFCVAVFFLILNAQFVAAVQILVYAGAIMVLFVFVIMLLNASGDIERMRDEIRFNKAVGAVLGVLLLAEGVIIVASGIGNSVAGTIKRPPPEAMLNFGTPQSVGEQLFTTYLLPFEVTSVLLLIAMIGALVIAKKRMT